MKFSGMGKVKEDSYWISAGKFALIERIANLIFGFGSFYMLVRIFDKEPYGIWLLFVSISTLVEVARNGFFRNPLIRFMNTTSGSEKTMLQNTSLILHVVSSLVVALALYGLSFPLSIVWEVTGLSELFFFFLLASLALPFFFHFEYMLVANFDFKGSFFGQLVRTGSIFFFISYFFFTKAELGLPTLAICYVLSVFLGTLMNAWSFRKYASLSLAWNPKLALKLFNYGKYTLGTNIAAVLLRNIDAWMLALYISPVAVAVYNVAIRISNLFEVPTMALASVLFPKAAKDAAEHGEAIFKTMYEKSVAAILLMSIPMVIVVLLFSSLIIQLFAGSQYESSVGILQITIFYGLILPFNKQMGILLDAVGRAKTNMYFVILAAILNTILNATLIPLYGVIGAASATLSTFLLVVILNLIYLNRKYDVKVLQIFKYIGFFTLEAKRRIWDYLKIANRKKSN